ncbi:MAG: FKBP-type peptidyl-prolyl cis-trans isomerase [Lacibacter sp.]
MKISTLTISFSILTLASFAQTKKAPVKTSKPVVKTSKTGVATTSIMKNGIDSLSYAIGVNIGGNMKMQGIEKLNYAVMNKGMEDALKGNKLLMDENSCNMTIQQKLQQFMSAKINVQKEEGRKFLEENKKQPGVVVLPSGIQYKIINQGTGAKPVLEDTIKVHYKGTTLDGNVFDDSYSRGEPIEFPLGNLIEGWKQTLILMPVGSKWQLFIPSDYAYGDRGAGNNIPGGATLVFELELLDVKPVKK